MGMAIYTVQHISPNTVANADAAARELREQAASSKTAQIIYFASDDYNPARLAAAMKRAFPSALTLGCASNYGLAGCEFVEKSVVAIAFDEDMFDFFDCAVIRRTDASGAPANPAAQVEEVFAQFEKKLGRSMAELEHDRYVGLAFADGREYYIEPVLERAGDLTSVPFIGGVASDGGRFTYTPVFCDGAMHADAVVLALAKPRGRFALVKTEGLELQDKTFTVTGVDEAKRLVTHLDGRPAAAAYREAIGFPEKDMELFGVLDQWPLGLMAGDTPFLRVATEELPDGSLRFLNAVKEGMRLKIGRPADIVETTRVSMEKVRAELGGISAVLHINCLSRLFVLQRQGQEKMEEFGRLFAGCAHAGFFSHGEFYIAIANITSVMLVFA